MRTEDGWRTVEVTHRCGRSSLLSGGRTELLWSSTGADAEHARPLALLLLWVGLVSSGAEASGSSNKNTMATFGCYKNGWGGKFATLKNQPRFLYCG